MVFWNLILLIAGFALQMILAPKPQNPKPASLEDFQLPTAEEGREIPVLFGEAYLKGPNVVWYGDFEANPREGPRKYGFFGPRTILGYYYYLGIHMVLCHGVIDSMREIRVGDKLLWQGSNTGTQIEPTNKELFGGPDREGGIRAPLQMYPGTPTQTQDSYLQGVYETTDIPAYRGVCSVILKHAYLGTNAYIKPWAFRMRRILKTSENEDQWYAAKAPIGFGATGNYAICFIVDMSSTVDIDVVQAVMAGVFDQLRDALSAGVTFDLQVSTVKVSANSQRVSNATTTDVDDIETWFNSETVGSTFRFLSAAGLIDDFFSDSFADGDAIKRACFFVTQGSNTVPSGNGTAQDGADAIADELDTSSGDFNVADGTEVTMYSAVYASGDPTDAELMQNSGVLTIDDSSPVDASELTDALAVVLEATNRGYYDMNPAHIIRECLTDPNFGMGYTSGDIGTSFTTAADTLFDEDFGLSLIWSREEGIEEFIQIVLAHIDAYLYVDRTSGLFELKLIRNDYTIGSLPVIDDDDIIDWNDVSIRQPYEAVTSLTVKFTHRARRKDNSLTAHNIAQFQQTGRAINATRNYPGIQLHKLASRVALRDLRSLGAGIASGTIVVTRQVAYNLNPGDPFYLDSTRHGIDGAMRVVDMKLGDGRDNTITLKFVQDVFKLDADLVVGDEDDDDDEEEPYEQPLAASARLVWEMPYAEMVELSSSADADSILTTDPDAGTVEAAAQAPANGEYAIMAVDEGSGMTDVIDRLYFAPTIVLNGAISSSDTAVTVDAVTGIGGEVAFVPGRLATIDDEIVKIVSLSGTTLTIARGCLDSIPASHADNTPVIYFQYASQTDYEIRTASESVDVELRTVTGSGELRASWAPDDTVVFASRAIRPLRPAKVQVNGEYGYDNAVVDATPSPGTVEVSWVNRKRTAEISSGVQAWTEGTDAAETGQTTTIYMYDPYGTLLQTYNSVTSPYTIPSSDYGGQSIVRIKVVAMRDGYESWTGATIRVQVSGSAGGWLLLETGDGLLLETGGSDHLRTEDS